MIRKKSLKRRPNLDIRNYNQEKAKVVQNFQKRESRCKVKKTIRKPERKVENNIGPPVILK
jgi:hypothetical protein